MSFLANSLIRLYGGAVSALFDQATKRPAEAQRKLLRQILAENHQTEFGKSHGFGSLNSEAEYREAVPARDFEGFRPFVQRVLAGERSVLTAAEPIRFNVTSGTTGERKFIPITRRQQKHELNLIAQWYYRALNQHPGFLDHNRVAIVSPPIEGHTDRGIPYGNASGMIFDQIPRYFQRYYGFINSLPSDISYDDRYFLIARYAVEKDVSFMMTPNPSTFVRLADIISENAEPLIRAIYAGGAGRRLERPELFPVDCFKPQPDRARFLAERFSRVGTLRPQDIWPNLKLIGCWLGGSAGVQAAQLAAIYGDVPIRDLGYMASEAHISIPYEDNNAAGVLAIQSNYYEFIPEEHIGLSNLRVLNCHELEIGKRYALLLTTFSGLYRYDINDIVEVSGFYNKTPVLAFCRKGRDMTNITGEKMHANHFIAAMELARKQFNLSFRQFRAISDVANSRYVVELELTNSMDDEILRKTILPFLDQTLQKLNIEYSAKRESCRLKPPALALMRKGWADNECRRFRQSGKNDIQFKWRALCPEATPEDKAAVLKTLHRGDEHD